LRCDGVKRADGVPRDARYEQVEEGPATHSRGADYSFTTPRIAFTPLTRSAHHALRRGSADVRVP
jgi:hypothetical protein